MSSTQAFEETTSDSIATQSARLKNFDSAEQAEAYWRQNIYQGDRMPQLTLRAILMGGLLGSLMSISNLYTSIKIGWLFGVAITACVLSFVIWNAFCILFPRLSPMSILENNCMQSTASAAGYSTGSTIGTAFGAYLLITGHHLPWQIVLPWTFLTACLGVFLAVPLKRQMINVEQLPFPSGIAAAETLRSLHGRSKKAMGQAYALICTMAAGALVGLASKGNYAWQKVINFKLPELVEFRAKISGVEIGAMPGFGFEPSLLLIAAGMIVGMRVCASMLVSALFLYLVVGPQMIHMHEISSPEKLLKWSLWGGAAIMVTSGLTAFALQWKTIARSFRVVKKPNDGNNADESASEQIEVPLSWFLAGVIPLTICMVLLEWVAASISPFLGLLAVVLSGVLALIACRSTGETDITPIGAMGKLSQLTYALISPSNPTTNLLAGSVTANTASASADLLTDLKSGYLLGANPKKQFLAQFAGVFFGTAAIVPAWYLMIPNKAVLEAYNPPSTNLWKAVAEALSYGIQYVPVTARMAMLVGGLLGIILAVLDVYAPPKLKRFLPSGMGLGLAWIMTFSNSFSFFLGAAIALLWNKLHKRSGENYIVPIASGAIAGESLACAIIAMISAVTAFGK